MMPSHMLQIFKQSLCLWTELKMFIIYLTFCVCLHSVTPFMVWSCPEWHWSTLVCKLSMTPLSGLTMRSLTITQGNVIGYVTISSPHFLKTRNALNTYWNSKLFQRYLKPKPKNWTEFKHLKMRIKRGNCDHIVQAKGLASQYSI